MENKYTAEMISRRLAELGKTQEWLAEICGVSIMAVSKWTRTGKISRDNARVCARALGVSLGELLGESVSRKVQTPEAPAKPPEAAPPAAPAAPALQVVPAPSLAPLPVQTAEQLPPGIALVYLTQEELALVTAHREATTVGRAMLKAAAAAIPKNAAWPQTNGGNGH